ncbi:MAG: cell division protein FtsA [Bacteroidaceae bacterium]|nr:cell division protein FtsA [Bacteroidaceae bacterium]
MGAAKDIIVAVELGSSAIRAIAGKRQPDGTLQILAVSQEENNNCIRNGIIDNLDKTSSAISRVIKQLDDKLNIQTKKIYIGLSGQSLHTVKNTVIRSFETKTLITNSMIESLKDINKGTIYPDAKMFEAIPQEYNVGYRTTSDPVGLQSNVLEACFANVIARTSLSENIERCVQNASLEVADIFISPICLSEALLQNNDKRSGCALVDIGADTTTIVIYTNNIMRSLTVIPLGGSNVTSDIASQNIELDEAEELKLKYGSALHEEDENKQNNPITISHGRQIDEHLLQDIIEARYEEILLNAWSRIKEYSDKLLSGITFTGGASRIANLKEAFEKLTNFEHQIRIAKGLPTSISIANDVRIDTQDTLYTLMALAISGEPVCAGDPPTEPEPVQAEIDFTIEQEKDNADIQTPIEEPEETETQDKEEEKQKKERKKSISFAEKCKKAWDKINEMLSEPEDE